MKDFTVQNEGSIFLLIPNTIEADEWLDEHIGDENMTMGKAIVIEHRFIQDIIDGIRQEGLTVEPN